ncbi:MAG: ATP-dependent sacrificial sulfur transferase LarE [Bacteroidota bacterium]
MRATPGAGAAARLYVGSRGPGDALEVKRAALAGLFAGMGRTLVAYSGGVDSTLLLVEARAALGEDAVGVIARSPSLPASELDLALRTAAEAGAAVRVVETRELDRPLYRANEGDRCYHCKAELFERLGAMAEREGFASLAYGAVTDDLGDVRPGMEAARAFRVRAPLLEAGLSKLDVRLLARKRGLRVWDKPQAACLASRIPVGSEVTAEKLRQVEGAEEWIRAVFGVRVLRVRHVGDTARIEVDPLEVPLLNTAQALRKLELGLQVHGFSRVEVDPRGYRRADPIPVISAAKAGEVGDGDRR